MAQTPAKGKTLLYIIRDSSATTVRTYGSLRMAVETTATHQLADTGGSDVVGGAQARPTGEAGGGGAVLGGRGRGAAAAPFPVAGCARSPQLQPLSPVAASSILVFFGASILVLPKCPDPKQEVSAMEPSGPGLCRSRSAQCGQAGPFAGLGCRRRGAAGGVGVQSSPSRRGKAPHAAPAVSVAGSCSCWRLEPPSDRPGAAASRRGRKMAAGWRN